MNLKKVGAKSLEKLNNLGFFCYEDLLCHYPSKITKITPLVEENLIDSNSYTINATIISQPILSFFGPKKNVIKFKVIYNNTELNVSIFGRPFYKKQLQVGNLITLIGKYNAKFNSFSVIDLIINGLQKPMYVIKYLGLSRGKDKITQEVFSDLITQILNSNYQLNNYISEQLRKKYKLIARKKALKIIHNPIEEAEVIQSLRYLKFEELYLYFLQIELLIQNVVSRKGFKLPINVLDSFIEKIGFELTQKQRLCLEDCIKDLQQNVCTKRLIQGDVGCGKTIVAFLVVIYTYLNHKKSIMIAPTSILAKQHYDEFVQRFPTLNAVYVDSKTLNASLIKKINNGNFDILIGTTSIMSKRLMLASLEIDLVIIDEQQRFGVSQRIKLEQELPHISSFYMSATPIPRTLELSNLGYLNTSIIDQYPKTKKEIWTKILDKEEKTFGIIEDELKKNNKIYVVVSRIDSNNELVSIKQELQKYQNVFTNANICLLHSKLTSEEKNLIFSQFNDGIIDILIATTIIEVGVNNKDATVIVINDAQMYGISQLHQLRGRVGRGVKQSYAFLIYPDFETNKMQNETFKRLDYLTNTLNGFELANFDLKHRGSGSIISEKQSGQNDLKLCNLNNKYDQKIAKYAKLEAQKTLQKENKNIEENNALKYVTNKEVTHLN